MGSLTVRLGLSNQEGPPAGGFFCCAEFAARGRVSGFEIRPGSDSRGRSGAARGGNVAATRANAPTTKAPGKTA